MEPEEKVTVVGLQAGVQTAVLGGVAEGEVTRAVRRTGWKAEVAAVEEARMMAVTLGATVSERGGEVEGRRGCRRRK